jgi:hypothetical protein
MTSKSRTDCSVQRAPKHAPGDTNGLVRIGSDYTGLLDFTPPKGPFSGQFRASPLPSLLFGTAGQFHDRLEFIARELAK